MKKINFSDFSKRGDFEAKDVFHEGPEKEFLNLLEQVARTCEVSACLIGFLEKDGFKLFSFGKTFSQSTNEENICRSCPKK